MKGGAGDWFSRRPRDRETSRRLKAPAGFKTAATAESTPESAAKTATAPTTAKPARKYAAPEIFWRTGPTKPLMPAYLVPDAAAGHSACHESPQKDGQFESAREV
jgi:hypothetical protein